MNSLNTVLQLQAGFGAGAGVHEQRPTPSALSQLHTWPGPAAGLWQLSGTRAADRLTEFGANLQQVVEVTIQKRRRPQGRPAGGRGLAKL